MPNFIELTLEDWEAKTLVNVESIERIAESNQVAGCILHMVGRPPLDLQASYETVALQILAATIPPPTINMPAGDEEWAATATELQLPPENDYD